MLERGQLSKAMSPFYAVSLGRSTLTAYQSPWLISELIQPVSPSSNQSSIRLHMADSAQPLIRVSILKAAQSQSNDGRPVVHGGWTKTTAARQPMSGQTKRTNGLSPGLTATSQIKALPEDRIQISNYRICGTQTDPRMAL